MKIAPWTNPSPREGERAGEQVRRTGPAVVNSRTQRCPPVWAPWCPLPPWRSRGHRNWRGLRRGPGPPALPTAPILRPPEGGGLAVPPLAGRSGPPFRPRCWPLPACAGRCPAPGGSAAQTGYRVMFCMNIHVFIDGTPKDMIS